MRLIADLKEAGATRQVNGKPIVLVARLPSSQFEFATKDAGFQVLADRTGELWAAAHVTTTPLVVATDSEHRVLTKAVTIDVASVATATP